MTDRELLEMAAKAAGMEYLCWSKNKHGDKAWNPLFDDGDALRLAVKRDIRVGCDETRAYCDWWAADGITLLDLQEPVVGGDKLSATRRAIVRAAAEIGKGMP